MVLIGQRIWTPTKKGFGNYRGLIRAQIAETWYTTAHRKGMSKADCERIAPAFVYPGLDLDHVESADLA